MTTKSFSNTSIITETWSWHNEAMIMLNIPLPSASNNPDRIRSLARNQFRATPFVQQHLFAPIRDNAFRLVML